MPPKPKNPPPPPEPEFNLMPARNIDEEIKAYKHCYEVYKIHENYTGEGDVRQKELSASLYRACKLHLRELENYIKAQYEQEILQQVRQAIDDQYA